MAKPSAPSPPKPTTRIEWVPVEKIRVSETAQREFRPHRANQFAANFDPDAFGRLIVNFRDGHWWVIDGQHRLAAVKILGWTDIKVECECYEGLTEKEEAE